MENQQIEYQQIFDTLRQGVSVLWDAFRTFFVINTLLLGIVSFLYSKPNENLIQEPFVQLLASWVSVIGVVASIGGIVVMGRFSGYLSKLLTRGLAVELSLSCEILSAVSTHRENTKFGAPQFTITICVFFGITWFLVLAYSICDLI